MKKILAVTALVASSISCAHAEIAPAADIGSLTNGQTPTVYNYDYNAQAVTATPAITTQVKNLDPVNAENTTVLTDTVFTVPDGVAGYKVEANYSGANQTSFDTGFSKDGTQATTNKFATVHAKDVAHIVLTKVGVITPGVTHVTYTITGYGS